MDIKEFKDILFEKAENACFSEYEVTASRSESFSVTIFKGNIEKYSKNITGGVGFRGIIGGKTGYSYSEDISEEAADFIVKEAAQNAFIMDEEETEEVYEGEKEYPETDFIYNLELEGFKDDEKIALAEKIEKAAYAYSPKIELVTGATVATGCSESYISNSKGLDLYKKCNSYICVLSVIASEGDKKKTGSEVFLANRLSEFDLNKLVESACGKAVKALEASTVKSFKGKVIFENEAFSDILEVFSQNFFGELAQKGFSLLASKEGEKIASDIVTIKDDPLLIDGYGSSPFDDEGVASRVKTVVEKGVLKTLLYTLKSAKKAEGSVLAGNGYRPSYKGSIQTSTTNFYIEKGDLSYNELVEKLQSGVIITKVTGLHAGANPISGDFSLLCEGFLAENGKIKRPVDQITCAGNFYSVMKDILLLGNDLKFSLSGIGSPSVLVDNISISGS
ncbi:MAG: TldD/PmbA family protein [Clostridiales bacterium]|nr:TldD/PmbA family protein [Clostridiales bacterium]